jgi:hypothetical protein
MFGHTGVGGNGIIPSVVKLQVELKPRQAFMDLRCRGSRASSRLQIFHGHVVYPSRPFLVTSQQESRYASARTDSFAIFENQDSHVL